MLTTQIDFRLIPIMAVLYLLAHIDRGNIGNAKIEGMDKDLGLTGNQYNIASTIFFVPYIIFGKAGLGEAFQRRSRLMQTQRSRPTSFLKKFDPAFGFRSSSLLGVSS